MNKSLFMAIALVSVQAFAGHDIRQPKAKPMPKPKGSYWSDALLEAISLVPEIIVEGQIPVEVHGKYCGPFHGDASYEQTPVDSVDAACKAHDFCYDANYGGRYRDCACDAQLVRDLLDPKTSRNEALSFRAIAVGAGMIGWFSQSTCDCKRANGRYQRLEAPTLDQKNQCL